MTFITWYHKDQNNRKFFYKVELKKIIIRSLIANILNERVQKYHWYQLMQRFDKRSSRGMYRHGCMITGNSKSVFRMFCVSRHVLKHLVTNGVTVGTRTSSF